MHEHHIAHLDISMYNLLTDGECRCACIDFQLSRRFDGIPNPQISGSIGTEIPPELEHDQTSNPYSVDVWALGVLVLRAAKVCSNVYTGKHFYHQPT
jgi:serine/threonine protein kinase